MKKAATAFSTNTQQHTPLSRRRNQLPMTSKATVTRERFLALFAFCINTACNAMIWITFAPIASLTSIYYGIDLTSVNALSVVFLAAYVPGNLIANFTYSYLGMRKGMLVACLVQVIGAWMRYGSAFGSSFALLMVGQFLCALIQPFFTNLPAKIAGRWFPVPEREIATSVATMFNPIGIAIGTLVPSGMVALDITTSTVVGFESLLLMNALFASAALLVVLFGFRERPNSPPSASQEHALNINNDVAVVDGENRPTFKSAFSKSWQDVKICFKEPAFVALFVADGIGLGLFNALSTLIEQITAPVCPTPDDASLFGGLLIGLGLIGAIVVGIALDRTHKYKLALRIGFTSATVFVLGLTVAIYTGSKDGVAALFGLLGFFMLPMLPASFSAAAECTYPVPEDISSGLLMTVGQFTGIAFIFGLEAASDGCPPPGTSNSYNNALIILDVFIVLSCISIYFYNGQLKRLDQEQASAAAAPIEA